MTTPSEDTAPPSFDMAMLIGSDAQGQSGLRMSRGSSLRGLSDFHMLWNRQRGQMRRVQVRPGVMDPDVRRFLHSLDGLVNVVTDMDQNPGVLETVEWLLDGYTGRVVNHPSKIRSTTRDLAARTLKGIPGLFIPPVARLRGGAPERVAGQLERAGMGFPAIVRIAGRHTGDILGVFQNAEEFLPQMENGRSYYVTRFVNSMSQDGLFRKYRVFMIGGVPVVRHLLVSDHWNVHAADRERVMVGRPDLLLEERMLMAQGMPAKVNAVLAAMHQRFGLEYFGVDFALTPNDDVILFEANATMNFFPFSDMTCFDYVKESRGHAQLAFDAMLFPEMYPVSA